MINRIMQFLAVGMLTFCGSLAVAEPIPYVFIGKTIDTIFDGEIETSGTYAGTEGDWVGVAFAMELDINNASQVEIRSPTRTTYHFEGGSYGSLVFHTQPPAFPVMSTIFSKPSVILDVEQNVDLTGITYQGNEISGEYDVLGFGADFTDPETGINTEVQISVVGDSSFLDGPIQGVDLSSALAIVGQLGQRQFIYDDEDNLISDDEIGFARLEKFYFGPIPEPVPVPAAAWLFGSALVALAGVGRNRHK